MDLTNFVFEFCICRSGSILKVICSPENQL